MWSWQVAWKCYFYMDEFFHVWLDVTLSCYITKINTYTLNSWIIFLGSHIYKIWEQWRCWKNVQQYVVLSRYLECHDNIIFEIWWRQLRIRSNPTNASRRCATRPCHLRECARCKCQCRCTRNNGRCVMKSSSKPVRVRWFLFAIAWWINFHLLSIGRIGHTLFGCSKKVGFVGSWRSPSFSCITTICVTNQLVVALYFISLCNQFYVATTEIKSNGSFTCFQLYP